MIFSQADFDLLCLLRWCRHIRAGTLHELFAERDIQNLKAVGFMKLHHRSGSYILTAKGNRLLNDTLPNIAPDTPPSYGRVKRFGGSDSPNWWSRLTGHISTSLLQGRRNCPPALHCFSRQLSEAEDITLGEIPVSRPWRTWGTIFAISTMSATISGKYALQMNCQHSTTMLRTSGDCGGPLYLQESVMPICWMR